MPPRTLNINLIKALCNSAGKENIMTTIPIEVILQDAESPVTPTPESGEETNITVPDTGTISDVGSNSGGIGSSASSIILPATILVLALGAIVASLVRRQQKRKKSNTGAEESNAKLSKKEKFATVASGTIAILAATVLVGNLVIPATKAATSDVGDSITPSEDKVSIIVTRDGGVAEASIESTATITSTSDFGYKVLLSMAEGAETSNLYLNGDEASGHYIAAAESTELGDNTWGFALTEDGEYRAMPLLADAVVVADGDEPVEDEEMSIYYGVRISSDLPAGVYSGGEIEYSLVSLEPTISTLTYLQDFAKLSESGKASVLRSMAEDQQYHLKDNRDDKTYRIAKLKDGRVWMTQNLDFQKEGLLNDITLNSDNTDHPASGFALPDSQTDGTSDWGPHDDQVAVNTAHVYDLDDDGETYYDCEEYDDSGNMCVVRSEEAIPSEDLGNLYNWYSATAGTGAYSLGKGDVATGSICPAGWKLPNSATSDSIAVDYSILLNAYGVISSATYPYDLDNDKLTGIFESPLSLIRAGYYGGGADGVGFGGYLWSSMAGGVFMAYVFQFGGHFSPWGSGQIVDGFSVRCLAR